ncbi:MAG: FeoB-associated Cys-rich membrane protein [Firmicutes bacterium]|nr:FeoB-associated Cys-rich membrane protein [Bacillota bacterium]
MTAADIIIGLVVAAAVLAAVKYIRDAKKKGIKCVGCPEGASCAMKGNGGCNCSIPEDFKIEK